MQNEQHVMKKKRIILAAAIMSMSLIAFMSMNSSRASSGPIYIDISTQLAQ